MSVARENLLPRLLEAAQSLSDGTDIASRLRGILAAAAELTGSGSASLIEYDESALNFRYVCASWHDPDAGKPDSRIPLNGSVAGWAFLNRASLIVDDAKNDPRHSKKVDEVSGVAVRSALGSPVLSRGVPIGALEVFNKPGKYTDDDILVVETLAALASAAMRNDILERELASTKEETRELDRLKNEFIAITSHELRTPLGLILGHATFLKELLAGNYDEQVDSIVRNASRLKEIIESLTSVDNYQTGGALVRPRLVSMADRKSVV